ncbi:hypothetical protein GCM10009557_00850 [Virgisporangium ochraceum]|uniref:Uncharacterized protein n=1 Tax=Virgisporangium ochraceum TaxID=65505 RepID=A0A8J4A1L7_9ACTN|nr:hypothetical protein [Virgisporangium ochraceum]GIJ74117.1 hypothetical protein Voc01_090340 [Virgisporangium ochraceum]
MRISPGDIRNAIVNPSYRIPKTRPEMKSADSVFRKAIRLYHTRGVEEAMHYIESALAGEAWQAGRGATLAKNARQDLDAYIDLAAPDRRVAATVGKKQSVHVGELSVAADVDVVLAADGTYVGRMAITANLGRRLRADELALIAAAPLRGLIEDFEGGLFDDIVQAIEVWELRLAAASVVARSDAEAAWPSLVEHLRRAASS